jgi:hypothetical protein
VDKNQTVRTVTSECLAEQNPVCAKDQEEAQNMGGGSLKPAEGERKRSEGEGGQGKWNGNAGQVDRPNGVVPHQQSQARGCAASVAEFRSLLAARLACPSNEVLAAARVVLVLLECRDLHGDHWSRWWCVCGGLGGDVWSWW